MTTPEQIKKALASLDVGNDNHWTADGLPRLETVKLLAGDQSITRDLVTSAVPGFSRASAVGALQAAHTTPPAATAPPVTETPAAPPAAVAAGETAPVVQPETSAPVAPAQVVASVVAGLPPAAGLPQVDSKGPNPLARVPRVDNTELSALLSDELTVLEAELHVMAQAKVKIEKRTAELNAKADDLRAQRDKLTPHDDNQLAIQSYLTSQRRILEARASQIGKVRNLEAELGVKLADLAPKRAPIDMARARKR